MDALYTKEGISKESLTSISHYTSILLVTTCAGLPPRSTVDACTDPKLVFDDHRHVISIRAAHPCLTTAVRLQMTCFSM